MSLVNKTIKGFLMGIGIYGVLIELIGLFFAGDKIAYTLGVLFGLVVAVFLILHIAYALNKALDMPEKQASKYTMRQAFIRLGIMLIVMAIALRVPGINFIATLLGILGLKIGAFIASPLLKRIYPDDFVTKSDEIMISEGKVEGQR